jgi:phosphoserine phosphatase
MTGRARKFDAICFDCDSTLSRIEGIDELALRAGREAEIVPLTEAAMNGSLPIEAIYARRLSILRPDRDALAWLGERYVEEMVAGAAETVDRLQRLGKAVYVVSGGLLPAVARLADALGLPPAHIHAVSIQFDADGAYRGFDANSPLCRHDGKAAICQRIAARHGSVAMVGDGITDIAARSMGAYVVGFGGVVNREAVAEGADCFVATPDLTATLEPLLGELELRNVHALVPRRS